MVEPEDRASAPTFGTTIFPLHEVPDKTEYLYRHYDLDHAEQVFWTYPISRFWAPGGGCNAFLVGPDMMITASHCGWGPGLGGYTLEMTTETFDPEDPLFDYHTRDYYTCHWLLESWWDSDIAFWRCDPGSDGLPPGDRFGYVDLDTVPMGTAPPVDYPLYTVCQNSCDECPPGREARFMMWGSVQSNTVTDWYTPGRNAGDPPYLPYSDKPIGLKTSFEAVGGCSGGAGLSVYTNRVVMGPWTLYAAYGAWWANSMSRTAWWSRMVDGSSIPPNPDLFNHAYLNPLGLTESQFVGYLDGEPDGVFDIQRAIEGQQVLVNKPIFWLGVENRAKNARWWTSPDPGVTTTWAIPAADHVRIVDTLTVPNWVLGHPLSQRAELLPNTTYRVTFKTYTYATGGPTNALRMLFWSAGGGVYTGECNQSLGPLGTWRTQSCEITTGGIGDEAIWFRLEKDADILLANIAVAAQGATWDFDTYDARYAWRDANTGNRSLIEPLGLWVAGPFNADWAGSVVADINRGNFADFSLSNGSMGLKPSTHYRFRFRARTHPVEPLMPAATARGVLRVTDGGTSYSWLFKVYGGWEEYTSPCLVTPSGSEATLMFGTNYDTGGKYLVDELVVEGC